MWWEILLAIKDPLKTRQQTTKEPLRPQQYLLSIKDQMTIFERAIAPTVVAWISPFPSFASKLGIRYYNSPSSQLLWSGISFLLAAGVADGSPTDSCCGVCWTTIETWTHKEESPFYCLDLIPSYLFFSPSRGLKELVLCAKLADPVAFVRSPLSRWHKGTLPQRVIFLRSAASS